MAGLESFGVTVNVHSETSARGLEEGFRLPKGALVAGEQVYIASASRYMDGEGVLDPSLSPEDALGVEFVAD